MTQVSPNTVPVVQAGRPRAALGFLSLGCYVKLLSLGAFCSPVVIDKESPTFLHLPVCASVK